MNGVVLKVQDGRAVVLTESGDTVEIAYDGKRGERVELPKGKNNVTLMRFVRTTAAAAAAVAVIVTGTLWYSYTTVQAASYVTMDVNPSFEYTLNRRDRVITVEALDEDAEPFVKTLMESSIKGMTVTEAISLTTELLEEAGYFDDDENEVLISVTGEDEERTEALAGEVDGMLRKNAKLSPEIERANLEDRKAAKKEGLSTGAYLKAQKAISEMGQSIAAGAAEGTQTPSAGAGSPSTPPAEEDTGASIQGGSPSSTDALSESKGEAGTAEPYCNGGSEGGAGKSGQNGQGGTISQEIPGSNSTPQQNPVPAEETNPAPQEQPPQTGTMVPQPENGMQPPGEATPPGGAVPPGGTAPSGGTVPSGGTAPPGEATSPGGTMPPGDAVPPSGDTPSAHGTFAPDVMGY